MLKLHPFFSYFGSKYRLAKYYHKPQYDEIIEPFAGSAGYSLLYPQKNVYLYEAHEPIVELQDYLINVTESEILSLPLGPFDKNHPVESEVKCIPARTLLGFWLSESQTYASRQPTSKSRGGNWTEKKRAMIAEQLKHIRHWKVEKCSYEQIPNRKATWFIDPPYRQAGKRYAINDLTYSDLSQWCTELEGQIIVCEQNEANWLEFEPLKATRNGSNGQYQELVWYKGSANHDHSTS